MSSVSPLFRSPPRVVNARSHARFLQDVWRGLGARPKRLDCKYLYDESGSRLFEAITMTPEYYPTRCELEILRADGRAIGKALGPECVIIAPGGGNGIKLRALLEGLDLPAAAVLVDLSEGNRSPDRVALSPLHPDLPVFHVHADFSSPVLLPHFPDDLRRVVFFGGSTIGNFEPRHAVGLLRHFSSWLGPGGRMLVGTDLPKERSTLLRAYDDATGITAAFNLNLLRRINRDLGATFDLGRFSHRVCWNGREGRVEMHLRSNLAHEVRVADRTFAFERFETIHTENAYKWSLAEFERLGDRAGLRVVDCFTDSRARYALQLLALR